MFFFILRIIFFVSFTKTRFLFRRFRFWQARAWRRQWFGGEYDPEHFDIKEVDFDDPKERFKYAFEENE